VLQVEPVGLDDDFYDLGGDSIAAIRIAARARDRGLDVSAPDLFNHPTVGALGTPAEAPPVPARFELANLDPAKLEKIARLLDKRRGE
jgi:aryl carrier-like protein